MEIALRKLESAGEAPSLASELDAYIAQVASEHRDEAPPEGAGEALLARAFSDPYGIVLVALNPGDDARLGYCVIGPMIDPIFGDSAPMVLAMHVEPEWRRRGLSRALLARAREELMKLGQRILYARAGHNDDALISMGERAGFVRSWEVMELES